ncbi:hypothetical protein ALIPUT_00001, partial [Alistipes putredinis DSM 17216]
MRRVQVVKQIWVQILAVSFIGYVKSGKLFISLNPSFLMFKMEQKYLPNMVWLCPHPNLIWIVAP